MASCVGGRRSWSCAGWPAPGLRGRRADAAARKRVREESRGRARARERGVKKPLSTTFTQAETNSYLKFNAGDLLPTGMTQPMVTLIGAGRLSGNAVIDLDIVRQKSSSGGWLDPTSYLTGKLPVTASGRVITGDGKARFEVERAEISGVPIPQVVPRADGQLLYAHRGQPERLVDRRHLRDAREDPQHRRRARPLHRSSMSVRS